MYCYKCGVKNYSGANFCYKCGVKISHAKNNARSKICTANFLKVFAYNKLVKSKNKYLNSYFVVASAVLSTIFTAFLAVNLGCNWNYAISTLSRQDMSTTFLMAKTQSELAFRDVWCYVILIVSLLCVIACDIFLFAYATGLKSKNSQK